MDDSSIRVSDADRERAVSALREHLLAGRLTLEEFTERVGAALQARVRAELARIRQDLPDLAASPADLAGPVRRPARVTAALCGHVSRRGQFRLAAKSVAASACGDLDLDLRDAIISQRRTRVTVIALAGNVDVYVPEGVNVDVTGLTVLGHRRDWGNSTGGPEAPTVTLRVIGVAGTVDVWRVPPELRGSTYSDIIRHLEGRARQLPS
jgi:Domain of unknown function (DUF1707)/Cell wall-active antibiotics response 4TMS YvqF